MSHSSRPTRRSSSNALMPCTRSSTCFSTKDTAHHEETPPFASISARMPPTFATCSVPIHNAAFRRPALMALMLFHAARLDARLDDRGFALLMEDQDRSQWDQRLISRAREFLDQSAEGKSISTFHLEAGIALHQLLAKSYAGTNWPAILRLYDALISIHRSPVYLLNRAIVVAEIDGPRAGILADSRKAATASRCGTITFTTRPWASCTAARAIVNERINISNQPKRRPAPCTITRSSTAVWRSVNQSHSPRRCPD